MAPSTLGWKFVEQGAPITALVSLWLDKVLIVSLSNDVLERGVRLLEGHATVFLALNLPVHQLFQNWKLSSSLLAYTL